MTAAVEAPPGGTYGAPAPNRLLLKLMELYVRLHVFWYRHSGGRDGLTRMWGFPVVLLTTKGARSGLERTVALGGFPHGDDAWLVVATGLTVSAHHPRWLVNLLNRPDDVWLEVGKRRVKVRADLLAGPERSAALRSIVSSSARYGKYQDLTDREIPIVRLQPDESRA